MKHDVGFIGSVEPSREEPAPARLRFDSGQSGHLAFWVRKTVGLAKVVLSLMWRCPIGGADHGCYRTTRILRVSHVGIK